MANKIEVVDFEKRFKKFEKVIEKSAEEILKILKKKNVAVEIFLAGNRLMRQLNRKYRGKDKIADVLSFVEPVNFPHPERKERFLGEIYLNTAMQKTRHRILLIHAILHLLGYSHKRKSDRIKMGKKEKHVYHFFRHRNFAN